MSRRSKSRVGLVELISTLTVCAGVILGNVGYADPVGTKKILEEDGYTDIQVGGRQFFGCDRNFYRTTFTAKNSRGIKTHGLVCKSFLDEAAYIKRM
jgi:hypothetical protein